MNSRLDDEVAAATAPTTTPPPETGTEPRWPAGAALLTAAILPATTARRTHHVTLKRAYLVHLLAAAAGVQAVFVVTAFAGIDGPLTPASLWHALMETYALTVLAVERSPKRAALVVPIVTAAIELAFPFLALVMTPWGAGDEPLRSSYRNALRRTWLHTIHITLLITVTGGAMAAVDRVSRESRRALWQSYPPYPQRPKVPRGPGIPSAEWRNYEEEVRAYNIGNTPLLKEWQRQTPWYIEYPQILGSNAIFASIAWVLWALLRGVGAHRRTPRVERPPACESCGYNLTGMDLDSRCPECGEPVAASLGPDARRGTVWQRRRKRHRFTAWWSCAIQAIRRPRRLGRECPIISTTTDHRWFLAGVLPIVFLIGAFVAPGAIYAESGSTPFGNGPDGPAITMPGMAYLAVWVFLGITLLAACGVGLSISVREKRNLLAGAMQITSYLSGYMTIWFVFAAATGITMLTLKRAEMLHPFAEALRLNRNVVYFLVWFVPNAAWGVYYFVLVYRGTMATRYANR